MILKNLLLAVVLVLAMVTPSLAQTNEPPPLGAILDLNGLPVPHGAPVQYTVNFTAALSSTAITFAFREDPAFIVFQNASVVDQTTSSGNLLTNGNFLGGVYTDNGNSATPIGWTYANIFGAGAGGVVSTSCSPSSGTCWIDGAIQAYDAISQTIPTSVGDHYQISIFVTDNGGLTTFSDLSTNGIVNGTGGNGIDVLAYAQAGLPAPGVPEPATMLLLGLGLVGVAGVRRFKK